MKLNANLSLNGFQITDVGLAEKPQDVITKEYLTKNIATWESFRDFYLDGTNGNDENIGYTDNSFIQHDEDISSVAVKTPKKLMSIIPAVGAGRSININIAPGDYSHLNLFLSDYKYVGIKELEKWKPLSLPKFSCNKSTDPQRIYLSNYPDGSNANFNNIDTDKFWIIFPDWAVTTTLRRFTTGLSKFTIDNCVVLKDPMPALPSIEDVVFIGNLRINFKTLGIYLGFCGNSIVSKLGSDKFTLKTINPDTVIQNCYGPGIINTEWRP